METKTWDQCPNCGSTERIAGLVHQEQVEKGKAKAEETAFIAAANSIISNPARLALTAPVIVSFYDVCAGCGTYYCIRAEVKEVPITGQIRPNERFS